MCHIHFAESPYLWAGTLLAGFYPLCLVAACVALGSVFWNSVGSVTSASWMGGLRHTNYRVGRAALGPWLVSYSVLSSLCMVGNYAFPSGNSETSFFNNHQILLSTSLILAITGILAFSWKNRPAPALQTRKTMCFGAISLFISILAMGWIGTNLVAGIAPQIKVFSILPIYFVAFSATASLCIAILHLPSQLMQETHQHKLFWRPTSAMLLAMLMIKAYLMFSFYMLVWFGNISNELIFLDTRLVGNWHTLFITFGVIGTVLPLISLLLPIIRTRPTLIKGVAFLATIGILMESVWLTLPALFTNQQLHQGSIWGGLGVAAITAIILLSTSFKETV